MRDFLDLPTGADTDAARLLPLEKNAWRPRQPLPAVFADDHRLAERDARRRGVDMKHHARFEFPVGLRREATMKIAGPLTGDRRQAERISGDVLVGFTQAGFYNAASDDAVYL